MRKTSSPPISRAELDRLTRDAFANGIAAKKAQTVIHAVCSKCGALAKVSADAGASRKTYRCKECGHEQLAM